MSATLLPKPGEVGYTTHIPSPGQTSGIGVDPNAPPMAAGAPSSSQWVFTPYVTRKGEAVFSKTITIASGKSAGKTQTRFGIQKPDGKYKQMSMYEIKTGRKPTKKSTKKVCKGEKRSRKVSRKSSAPKSELAKARRKFNRRSKLKKKIDRSIQAETVVTKSRDYKPNQNDFKGLDTKRR